MLNRTVCDIHVFDPTVQPSLLRQREAELNAGMSRPRIWWHSLGISAQDTETGQYVLVPATVLTVHGRAPSLVFNGASHIMMA